MEQKQKQPLPNKAFDMEYSTMWGREVRFLQEKGIKCSFVKKTKEYGVSQFKYKKTPQLFAALIEFYTQVENEKALAAAEKAVQNGIEVKTPEDMEAAMQKLGIQVIVENGKPKFVTTEYVQRICDTSEFTEGACDAG